MGCSTSKNATTPDSDIPISLKSSAMTQKTKARLEWKMCQVKQTTITTTNNNSYRTMIFCLSSSVEGDTGAVLRFIRMCVVTHTIRRFCAVQSAAKRDTQPQSQSTRLTAKRWHNHRFSIIAYTKFELQSILEAAR